MKNRTKTVPDCVKSSRLAWALVLASMTGLLLYCLAYGRESTHASLPLLEIADTPAAAVIAGADHSI